jgi:hypothetical protein
VHGAWLLGWEQDRLDMIGVNSFRVDNLALLSPDKFAMGIGTGRNTGELPMKARSKTVGGGIRKKPQ